MTEKSWLNWNAITLTGIVKLIGYFHDWKVVAQLKPGKRLPISSSSTNFHDWKVVAQLKLKWNENDRQSEDHSISMTEKSWLNWNPSFSQTVTIVWLYYFHDWKVVAQLKPVRVLRCLRSRWLISMTEKSWLNWNHQWLASGVAVTIFLISMTEKSWLNWNPSRRDLISPLIGHHFHDWKVVAQLKPKLRALRSITRQSISMTEKSWLNWNALLIFDSFHKSHCWFPWLKSRGSIETLLV